MDAPDFKSSVQRAAVFPVSTQFGRIRQRAKAMAAQSSTVPEENPADQGFDSSCHFIFQERLGIPRWSVREQETYTLTS